MVSGVQLPQHDPTRLLIGSTMSLKVLPGFAELSVLAGRVGRRQCPEGGTVQE